MMLTPAIVALVALSVIMSTAWVVQRRTGNSGWVDVFWSFGVGLVGASAALWPDANASGPRQILIAVAVAAWSARLGMHIARRTVSTDDDPRYRKLKDEWGEAAQTRMLGFLQLQAFAAWLLVVVVWVAAHAPRPGLDWRDWLGIGLVLASIVGEARSDRQVKTFGRNPANRGLVCDTGLWRYSRHPNYFFEWLGWVGYVIVAVDVTGEYPWGWLALIGPLYMYYLLVHVSGVPPLEEHMMRTRPDAFALYKARTNVFFPGPRREPVVTATGGRTGAGS